MFRNALLVFLIVEANLAAGEPLKLIGHEQEIYTVAFSPKGDRLASSANDRTIRIWTIGDGKSIAINTGFASRTVAFSPDGALLAGRFENKAALWNAVTGEQVAALAGSDPSKDGTVTRVAFNPDGKFLAVGHQMGRVRLWDVATRKPVADLVRVGKVGDLQFTINALAFPPNGKLLAVGRHSGLVVWNLESYAIERTLNESTKTFQAEFTPDGTRLLVNEENRVGYFRIWDVNGWKNVHTSDAKGAPQEPLKAVRAIDDALALGVNDRDELELFDLATLKRRNISFATPYRYAPAGFAISSDRTSVAHFFGGNIHTIFISPLPAAK